MVSIKTVAVLGGSGNLGQAVVRELVSAGFTVTGITREASTNSTPKFPEGLAIKTVDYASLDSLKSAFDGQDAVVSTIATLAVAGQKLAVDAAVAAGVKRFIPSEFGVNTQKVGGTLGKLLAGKVAVVDYLNEKAKENPSFSWTGLSTGLFFDWALEKGTSAVGVDVLGKTATIVDSGNEKFPASNLPQIGKAVVGILKHPDETANRYISAVSFNPSINELLSVAEELTGSKFAVTKVNSADLNKEGEEKLAVGDFRAFTDFLRAHLHGDGAGNAVEGAESANDLIGLPYEDVKETVKEFLKKQS